MLPTRLLGLGERTPSPRQSTDKLVRVATTVEPETPRRFLRRGQGSPRWFWQSGDAWMAGIGNAANLHIPADHPTDRFSKAKAYAELLQDRILHEDEDAPPAPLIGGFSFHRSPKQDPTWQSFGSATFTLPALTLHRSSQGATLVGTARVAQETTADQARSWARDALERAKHRLTGVPPRPESYQIPKMERRLDPATWRDAVEASLDHIRDEELRKIVLARTLTLAATSDVDPAITLANLRHLHPGTHLFLIEPTPGSAFLGASPELVADVDKTTFHANAVAGSVPRGQDESEDDKLARTLSRSPKHQEEHTIVVQAMRRRLARLADRVEVGRDTNVLRLRNIQHLEQDVYARIPSETHVLDIVQELHPTPAVCGDPRDAAQELLRRTEPFERGWYAGAVGWFNLQGDGTFAPGLRSAVLHEDEWRLFAGAGIVADSDPEEEWEETRVKFHPILDALGARQAPEGRPR